MKIPQCIVLVFFLLNLNGCATGVIAGTTVTLMATKKLPFDLAAETITGKNCSTLRSYQDGGPYCRSSRYGKYIIKKKYCYHSLGNVDCYNKPMPQFGQTIGDN